MSIKKRWLQVLSEIKKHDEVSGEVAQALELVTSFVKNLKEKESLPVSEGPAYPLPKELNGDLFSVALFCDGACRGNPGPGAFGAMAQNASGEVLFESSSVELMTTNNQMELQGAIAGLRELLERKESSVFVFTDSKYVVEGVMSWMPGWKKRGWKKADNKAPENLKLWQELDELVGAFAKISFHWVKGHAGHPQNERCDQLANLALDDSGF